MKLRELKATDVQFSVRCEFDDSYSAASVRGSFGTDEPEADEQQAREICDRVGRGDETAWCGVIVEARWRDHEAEDAVWGVTLGEDETATEYAKGSGMFEEALHALNEQIKRECEPKIVGMVATKYLGAVDTMRGTRGPRVKATNINTRKSAYVAWDYALDAERNHIAAAWKLMGAPPSHRSSMDGGGYMFAFDRKLDTEGDPVEYPTEES